MASIRRQKVGDRTYWQVVESHRVNGKPRPKVIKHIGTTDKLLALIEGSGNSEGFRFRSFSHGDVAALLKVADDFGITSAFDSIFPVQTRKSLGVGRMLLVGAVHRAVKPGSKRAFSTWAQTTTISRIMDFDASTVSSQDFWDQMMAVSKDDMEAAEEAMCRILKEKGLLDDTLLHYDLTNYFTYISTTNSRSTLAQRGHSKQRRNDLRCFGLSQVVTKDFLLPVFTKVYQGNGANSKQFSNTLSDLRRFLTLISKEMSDITLVFDRGSNSKANFNELDHENVGYVASLSPYHHKDLMEIPITRYSRIEVNGSTYPAFKATKNVWLKERSVVVLISEKLKIGQIRGWDREISKMKDSLFELQSSLQSPRSKRDGPAAIKIADKIIHPFYGVDLFKVSVEDAIDKGSTKPRLTWSFNEARYEELKELYAGKRILVTNRDWPIEEIISAYHSQATIEGVFRSTKNPFHNAVRPQYHFTDHMVEVHTFICLTGFSLSQLLMCKLKGKGVVVSSIDDVLERLNRVREVEIVEQTGKRGRPRITRQLENCPKDIMEIYEAVMEPS